MKILYQVKHLGGIIHCASLGHAQTEAQKIKTGPVTILKEAGHVDGINHGKFFLHQIVR